MLEASSVFYDHAGKLGDVDALHESARRALAKAKPLDALAEIQPALALRPNDPALWCTCGAAHRHALDFDQAKQSYERALALDARHVATLANLGEWHLAKGQPQEALRWLDEALTVSPDFYEAKLNRVAVLFELAEYDKALAAATALVADYPDRPESYVNLGNILVHTGKAKQAVTHYRKALDLRPGYEEAHFNLATLLGSQDDLKSAIGYLERQIKERGDSAHRLGLLAAAHQAAGHLTKATAYCEDILARQPQNLSALVTLASCVSTSGDAERALTIYQRIMAISPGQAPMGSNVLFESTYLGGISREALFAEHADWARRFESPMSQTPVDFQNTRDPARRLRIGYVSGDFCGHPVGYLILDILRHHAREHFDIRCFSMTLRLDDVSEEIQKAADGWMDIFLLSDDELVAEIKRQEIDILIDLSGHTALHRLLAFSKRAAPVQVTWIGYFHSTGMRSIDYFITDPYTSPREGGQRFSETPVHLPATRFCYSPPPYAADVVVPPCLKNGYVTFGSFNRLAKLNDAVIDCWAAILKRVPESRLILKAGALNDEAVRQRLLARFESRAIAATRLDLRGSSPHRLMFEEYGDVDLALDPFPFNGGMTTIEALWMGVPVLTLEGQTIVSRQSYALLVNLGLENELSAPSVDDYIARAVELASRHDLLGQLRADMRDKMRGSPLLDAPVFTRDLEVLYRKFWQAWCRGEMLAADVLPTPTPTPTLIQD